MSVSGIEAIGGFRRSSRPPSAPTRPPVAPRDAGPSGPAFGELLVDGIEGLEAMQDKTDQLSVQAATGDLGAIHDYTIAATETSRRHPADRRRAQQGRRGVQRDHADAGG